MKVQYHSNSFIFGGSLAVVTAGIFICTLCFHLIQQYSFMSFLSQLFCIFLRTLIFLLLCYTLRAVPIMHLMTCVQCFTVM